MARISIKVIQKGGGVKEFLTDINERVLGIKNSLRLLGGDAQDRMRNIINSEKVRRGSKNELEDAIRVHELKDGVGVGKISELPLYWYVLNYGTKYKTGEKFIPPANLGHFEGTAPSSNLHETGGGTDRWTHTGNRKDFLMKPKVFTPINYIEKTLSWIDSRIKTILTA